MTKKRYPHTVLQSVLLIAVGFIFGTPVLFISDYFHQSFTANEVFVFAFGSVIYIAAILIALLKNKRNRQSTSFNGRLNFNQGLILLLVTIISFQLLNASFIQLLTKSFSTQTTDIAHSGIVHFIGAILLSPILEEVLFRGTILNGMLENYTSRKAILLSAAFFALFHGKLLQIIPAFFWGLLLGYIFYKTRSIVLSILLHMTVNFTSTLSHWLHPANKSYTVLSAYGQYSLLFYCIALICLATGCYLLFKRRMLSKYLAEYILPHQQSYINHQFSSDI